MIVNAYAEGDRRTLKNLLAREVYDGFESAISEREKRGETVESRFVSIDNADITAAELRGRNAQVTVRFQSKLVSVTRNKDGNVIDGNAERLTDITDVWTFARDITLRDPNWKLLATEAGQSAHAGDQSSVFLLVRFLLLAHRSCWRAEHQR